MRELINIHYWENRKKIGDDYFSRMFVLAAQGTKGIVKNCDWNNSEDLVLEKLH